MWLLSLADLFFTIWAHLFTPFREMNPIAGALLGRGLIPSLVIYKLTVTLLGTATDTRYGSGRIGLRSWGPAAYFDELLVQAT